MPIAVTSRIHSVAVYQSGAQVTRVAELSGDVGAELQIGDLPLCLEDDSLQVRIEGASPALEVTGFRLGLDMPAEEQRRGPDEAVLRATWREEQLARQRLEQAKGDLSRWQQVGVPPRRGAKKGGEPTPPPPSPTGGRLALLDLAHQRMEALTEKVLELEGEIQRLQARLRELQAQYKEGRRPSRTPTDRFRKFVLVSLRPRSDAAASRTMRLVVEYRVPGARWAPAYALDFTPDLSMARLSARALVSQRTGEDWTGVRLSVSTAQAQRWTELPELASLRIGRRQPRPARAGWKEAPEGAEGLYEDYLRARSELVQRVLGGTMLSSTEPVPPPPPMAPAGVPEIEFAQASETKMLHREDTIDALLGAELHEDVAEPCVPEAGLYLSDVAPVHRARSSSQDLIKDKSKAREPGMARHGPAPSAAPAPARYAPAAEVGHFVGGGVRPPGAAPPAARPLEPPQPLRAGADWLDYGSLRMPAPEDPGRGRLAHLSRAARYSETMDEAAHERRVDLADLLLHAEMEATRNERESPPPGCCFPGDVEGFDHAYFVEGEVDVPSDGEYHGVPLASAESHPTTRFVAVPRVGPEVFRTAEVPNPLDAPLLAGPTDVRIGPDFLMTVPLRTTPARGIVRVGLGVEQGIKVARNTTFAEEATGMLGGTLLLRHGISIRLANRLSQPATIEVRERVPVVPDAEKEVRLQAATADPAWEDFEQDGLKGGKRWVVTVPAGKEQELKATYVIQIPSKCELADGNRREE